MTDYKMIDLPAGTSVEQAVNQLLEYRKAGEMVRTDFNGTTLYSDTVTMDDAYLAIVGHTKAEHDAKAEAMHRRHEQETKEHNERIPELTEQWIAMGNQIIAPDKQALWAETVPIRLNDLYRGMELGNCLSIVAMLNDNKSLEEAKRKIESQDHSGMSFRLVCSMVAAFAERGKAFVEYVQ